MKLIASILFWLFLKFSLGAADWPQYRGPNLDGTSPEKISKVWPKDGPRQIWKIPTPDGFSSFVVGDGKAFTQVSREIDGAL